ncbi:hypothetical protein [Hymenobacter cellulosivorans]|uniref:Uncharacterized protein n=1 Tax=Hymenobacter cellulosivorans TaxID=2932249 RepID=A0ABY4FGD1_9BACT|nr:hypothetical protein [Hymenobacter cellulosivorans]UOQ55590.1 hypothetical protein MUN80_12710 [Hymenobacter cellulosivorans]
MATNKKSADANEPQSDGGKMSPEQQKHHDELYNYKRDEEGTLDTSAQLEQETMGIPDDTTVPGATGDLAGTGDQRDNIIIESNNNFDNDNNR